MVTSVSKSGTQKLAKEFRIVETYWHDHSFERFWGALSDGTISFSIQPFSGEKCIFWYFFLPQKTEVLSSQTSLLHRNSIIKLVFTLCYHITMYKVF
jgi:hypothetical protein